jgi:N6-adenosine-specific RNA methylase IME4
MTLAFHPYANLFPLIEGQEFYDLAEDIRANGLHDLITLISVDGTWQILDGRNRYRALCWLLSTGEVLGDAWGHWAGEVVRVEMLADYGNVFLYAEAPVENDAEALAYVISKNLKRRHHNESQRAMVAARLGRLDRGGNRSKGSIEPLSSEQRAELLNVGRESVKRAQIVQDGAAPEIVEAVERGDLAVSAAAEIASQPAERQAEIVQVLTRDATGKLTDEAKKALAPLIREIRADKMAAKRQRRDEREQQTGRKIQQMPGNFFGVAIEDFEWHHAAWSEDTGAEKSPSMHYETAQDAQTPEAIVARCAERFACLAETCVIFKWVTIPHLSIGIKVLELQGFTYVTSLVWNKERAGEGRGTGYWFTGEHEYVLVGARGGAVAPATAHFRSNFSAPVGGHSEKPDNLHEIIEFHWPNTPKVEFNARRRRPGWEAWGWQAPESSDGRTDEAAARETEPVVGETAPAAPEHPNHDAPDQAGMGSERSSTSDGEGAASTGAASSSAREAFVAYREASKAEKLWEHPAVADHVVRMTRDYPGGVSFNVATCQCGWSFRVETAPFDLSQDQAVDAHWRDVIAGVSAQGAEIAIATEASERSSSALELAELPSGEAAAADATSRASAAAAASFWDVESGADADEVVTIEQKAGSDWLAPAEQAAPIDPASVDEREALTILSDFCHPRRAELADALGEHYAARGYTYQAGQGAGAVWSLRGQGWDRLRALNDAVAAAAGPALRVDLTEPYRVPQGALDLLASPKGGVEIATSASDSSSLALAMPIADAPPPEVVDGVLQTRLPVDKDELDEQLALREVDAGRWEDVDSDMLLRLVEKRFAHCATERVSVTDEGRAFLAQLVGATDAPPSSSASAPQGEMLL